MLGTSYRLGKPTRAVYADAARKGFVLLPEGAILTVEDIEDPGRLLKVRWNNLVLLIFCQDLIERGVHIGEPKRAARSAAALRQ
jgi:hypothetical protein